MYLLEHGLEIMLVTFGLCSVIILRVNYSRINKKREDEDRGVKRLDAELNELGDKISTLKYQL